MRSHLTRHVFRRLLANQPVVHHCQYHNAQRPRVKAASLRTGCAAVPSRTFLNLLKQARKDAEESRVDPGMEKMLELNKRIHLIARLPPSKDLVRALRAFARYKVTTKRPIEDFQAERLLQTLQTLEENEESLEDQREHADEKGWSLIPGDLLSVFKALQQKPSQAYTSTHNKLAQMLLKALEKRLDRDSIQIPRSYLQILCATGDSMTAKEALRRQWERDAAVGASDPGEDVPAATTGVWCVVLAGFSKEDNEPEMLRLLEELKGMGLQFTHYIDKIMAVHFARKDNVSEAKKWFTMDSLSRLKQQKEHPQESDVVPDAAQVYSELFQFCLRNGELEWGQSLLRSMDEQHNEDANELTWNAVFMASAAAGKSVDEIDRMITVMAHGSDPSKSGSSSLSIHTINGLIKFAIQKKDPYTAERYFGFATKWNVAPNVQTYVLQIEYRLLAGDMDGALASYSKLRELEVVNDEDWAIMNKLLQALLEQPTTTNEVIINLASDLSERRRLFDSKTVKALCEYHLDRDEYFEVVDLLETYAPQYSIATRIDIRNLLSDYTLDPAVDTGRAWDTYMIFHQIFDLETDREIRNQVMALFFDRKRPDLATHVFNRMHEHMRADTRPNADTYALAFEGISKTGDWEALEIIHNLFKLDTNTEPDTRLLNGLMLAYISCDMPVRALTFWRQISTSPEGPSYNSLHIAFRVCQGAPFGYEEAHKIWNKLLQADIEITRDLFASYATCLAGQALFDEVAELLPTMKKVTGCEVDLFTVGCVYNAAFGINLQMQIQEYCEQNYPKIWAQALENGRDEDELGMQTIRGIKRSLKL